MYIFVKKRKRDIASFISTIQKYLQNHNIDRKVDCKSFIFGSHKASHGPVNIFCLEIKRYIFLYKRKELYPILQGLKIV